LPARRGYEKVLAIMLVAAAVSAIAPGLASAGSPRVAGTPADRAAVRAYLLDIRSYVQALADAAPALVGAYEGAASRIAGECPGVLVGAPQERELEPSSPILPGSSTLSRTARQRGEEKRQRTQLGDLEEELASELASAEQEARRPAQTAFLADLRALPQGGPALSRVVHAQINGVEEDQQVQSTDVCADMRAWARSGYRTLSQASRATALKHEVELARFLKGLSGQSASGLTPITETPAERAIVRKTVQLELRTAKTLAHSIDSARKRVEAALGLTARAKLEERPKPLSHESKSSTKLGTGRTAAGTKYTVWLERTKGGPAGACKSRIEVRGAEGAEPGISELIIGPASEVCLAPRQKRSEEPTVNCSEGLLKIETEVPSAARTVDLRMSNGTHIVSRPVFVPRRLGGPAAFYYQAVRGPAPVPLSLTARDAHRRPLRVLKLRRIVGCSTHPLKYLPGGKRTLARGSTPQGPSFSIVGERYRLFGRLHTQLRLTTGEGSASASEGEEENVTEGLNGSSAIRVRPTAPLDSEISASCHPHEYSIFYGLLKQPRDTVLVKIAGKLVAALRIRIPSSLHAGGLLVYLASVSQPEQILVRSPSGKILMNEERSRAASEGRETCEGESEGAGPGAGPPPGGFGGIGETSRIVLNG
jgi:hypothetical protein